MLETVRVIMNLGKVYLARNHTSKTDMYGNNPNDNKDNRHILWLWLVENPNPYTVGWTGAFFGACLIMIQHVPTICLWSYTRNSRFIMLGIRYNHSVLFKQTFSHRYIVCVPYAHSIYLSCITTNGNDMKELWSLWRQVNARRGLISAFYQRQTY